MTYQANGWRGSYEGFRVTATEQIKLDWASKIRKVSLSSKDVGMRIFFHLPVNFGILLPGRLDQDRFVKAAALVLKSYPALGSRLQLEPSPVSLVLEDLSFPVSFATWPDGSAAQWPYDYQWEGSSDFEHLLPDPPFSPGLQVEEALKAEAPLFAVRVTTLGDGSTLLAVVWLHILTDAHGAANILNALAAAYKGLGTGTGSVSSPYLPPANVERKTWPWDLCDLPMAGNLPAERPSVQEDRKVMSSQDGLTEGPARVNDMANSRTLFGPNSLSHGECNPGWNALVTLKLHKDDIKGLKSALQSHPRLSGLAFSTNDVLLATIWLLQSDARGHPRPGQGPAGSSRGGAVVTDATVTWPELASPGYLGNLLLTCLIAVKSDGSAEADLDSVQSLHSALAQTIAATRTALKELRAPDNLRELMCTRYEGMLGANIYLERQEMLRTKLGVDGAFTNWNQAGQDKMDFGSGPPTSLMGHFGFQRVTLIGIVALSDGSYGARIFLGDREALQRLKSSPVFPRLVPNSGLL